MDAAELQAWLEAVLADQRAALFSEVAVMHEKVLCELRDRLEAPAGQADSYRPLPKPQDNTDSSQLRSELPQEAVELEGKRAELAAKKKASKQSFLQDLVHPSRLVHTTWFEILFSVLIILNALFMAVEMQYYGHREGAKLGYGAYWVRDKHAQDTTEQALYIVNTCFGFIFLLEVLIKMIGERWGFWRTAWNYFDLVLSVQWIATGLFNVGLIVRPGLLRLLRLLRLFRWFRLLRRVSAFDSLILMTTSLRSTLPHMLTACLILGGLQLLTAFVCFHVMQLWITDESVPMDDRHKLFTYFGTFSRCFLTMWEISTGNWPPTARLLMESISEVCIYFSVLHKCTLGLAVIGVINGVFMQETLKAAHNNHSLMVRQQELKQKTHRQMMQEFFLEAHTASDGGISKVEFEKVLEDPHVRSWFAAQELSMTDVGRIFDMMNNNDGELTPDELSAGVSSLKGPAKSLDMHILMSEVQAVKSDTAVLIQQMAKERHHTTSYGV
eukprot:TRINITY_DN7636_c0_g8_i1.p1 TRINITY_DN7636_c0_g8~~TRINITY_DN7636_c0_g8_i1.p1  ORF type:complete len:514 (+),score=83.94 TRINITY_DN7636_c0_g8_i1:50-1543(+)